LMTTPGINIWEDADGAVNQPGLSFPVFFGFRWKL
jgi:hypothetical protein